MIVSNVCRVVLQTYTYVYNMHTYDTWYCYYARVLSFPFLTAGFSQGCYDTARGLDEVVSHNCGSVLGQSHRTLMSKMFQPSSKMKKSTRTLCVLAGAALKALGVWSFSSECAPCLSLRWDESHPKARPGLSCDSAAFLCLQNHFSSAYV